MNRKKALNTFFWVVTFAAATFCIIPITFLVLAFSHFNSDAWLERIIWSLRLIFIASPVVAWLLGRRGVLPGTEPLVVNERRTNRISRILAFIAILVVVSLALGAWVAFEPVPGPPKISVTFHGYTNDATGTRLAKITVTNLNDSRILVAWPSIQIQSPAAPGGYKSYFSGVNSPWSSNLIRGASGSFTIRPPTNPSPWRLSFYVYPHHEMSAKNIIRVAASMSCMSVGLWPRYAKYLPFGGAMRMPYQIEGNWIYE